MKVIVTGADGMLGQDALIVLGERLEVFGVDIDDADLTDLDQAQELLEMYAPSWVVNCAAYTAVDRAEQEPDAAFAVNETATKNLALACRGRGARLLHVSTDYVFDGKKTDAYLPDDEPGPLGVYGKSKWAGEAAARKVLGNRCVILRTAWLHGPGGPNFVSAILAKLKKGEPLRVVNDQIGSPTYTGHLAEAILAAIESHLVGVHHTVGGGHCSWFDFAKQIAEFAGFAEAVIEPISSTEIDRPAPRPQNSRLDTASFTAATGYPFPDWREGLAAHLVRLGLR
ncbi:MAG: dTDP-4-dehydrorhamnose reductase [Candidatus Lernaella stagnicola]|nr:dTDP-4-dehydrorhamnose reductase [Candidatus Lernaella stagnicola]